MKVKRGTGGSGPWEDRSHLCGLHPNAAVVALHLNNTYAVQRYRHPEHPGVDHLTISRHDGEPAEIGWADAQRIKNRLAPNGTERFALEVFPPTRLVIDNAHLYHLWVMPEDWEPGFGLHEDQRGYVHI